MVDQWKGIRLNMAKNPDAVIELYRLTMILVRKMTLQNIIDMVKK